MQAGVGHQHDRGVGPAGPLRKGDRVVAPFAISDGTCESCRAGLHTSCAHPEAGSWDGEPGEGGQAEAVRVPLADGTLVRLPVAADSALIPSLLTLSDGLGTGYHAAVAAGIARGHRVAVIGTAPSVCWPCCRPGGWAPSRSS
ncbi:MULTISPECIES: alcohol dehydrogenase catalytic domain-containing protein [unclassified Blastococcus]